MAAEKASTTMTLWQKLVAIRRAVPALQKDGASNYGEKYRYVSSNQVLGPIRAAMDEHGVLLVPRVDNVEFVSKHVSGDKQHFTAVWMTFTFVDADNPADTVSFPWYAQGLDTGEKGPGKAYTYAEKFAILKFFQIATDGDDPDQGSPHNETDERTEKKQTKRQASKPTGPQNLGEFRQALTDLGIPSAQHQATCDAAAGRPVVLANMKPAAFAMVLAAVANPEPPEDPAPAPTPAPPTVDHADGAGPFAETGWTAAQPPTPTQLGEWVGQFGLPAQTLQIARGLAGLPGEQHMREFGPDQCWRFYDCLRWRMQYDESGTTWRFRLDEIGDEPTE